MPEAVVDCLEPVQVAEEHRDRLQAALGSRQRVAHAVEEERAVGQASQRIVERLVNGLLSCAGVVKRQARMLGKRQQHLLVARLIHATGLGGGDTEAPDDAASLEDRRRHRRRQAVVWKVGQVVVVAGADDGVGDDERSLAYRAAAEALVGRLAAALE